MKLVDALYIGAAATQIRWIAEKNRAAVGSDLLCPAVRDYLVKLEAAVEVLRAESDRMTRLGERSDLLPAPPDPFEPDAGEAYAEPLAEPDPQPRGQLQFIGLPPLVGLEDLKDRL